jgi:hypothetical protein
MAGKRDSRYFEQRLKREHPKAYSKLLAGRYPSVRSAAIDVGLIKKPTRFDALKRNWAAATAAEKGQFSGWLRAEVAKSAARRKPLPAITDARGVLRTDVVDYLKKWTRERRVRPGHIMNQMGFKNFDARLAEAMNRPHPLADEVVDRLKPWLATQGFR